SPVAAAPSAPGAPAETTETAPAADAAAPAGDEATVDAIIDDDEIEAPEAPAAKPVALPPEIAALSPAQIRQRLQSDPSSLGPMSVGWTNSGALVNGVQLSEGERYVVKEPHLAWATQETIDYLIRAIDRVHEQFPDSPELLVGHLSGKQGGHLSPHKSHQSGRDVDTSFYYLPGKHRWYRHANAASLDCPRTWAFLRALLIETDVQWIFINTSVQRLLKQHALSIGENPEWLDSVFQYKSKHPSPIIRHARGHATHIHIRFYNPIAQELGRRAYEPLLALGMIKPRILYTHYRAKKGDILGRIAKRYKTTIKAIQKANNLRSTKIFAKKVYRIPRAGGVRAPRPLLLPPRRLPPSAAPANPGPGSKAAAN
ncbi:MAG: penicillin-insensitive murein endopeptidase, partial [Deltaproteobacteria bacterium]|nr:penicillin-insensitive murein endopeptidase [Deltaproteobacteria bacterium]MBW2533431.1 penicillin-insensitive murein endopeptidase [Deltaproteobacteria bacterium]